LDIKRIVGFVDIEPYDCVIPSCRAAYGVHSNSYTLFLDLGFDALVLFHFTGLFCPKSSM